jgi:phosphoribosylanthranilate isomerase
MIVKICGITNSDDALAAVEAGATALGFNFYPHSPRHVTPAAAARIIELLPGTIWKVGVFVDEPADSILEIARRAGLDIAQLHGSESPAALPRGVRIWKAFRVAADFLPSSMDAYAAEAFLLDAFDPSAHGGTGQAWDWSRVNTAGRKIILAGGLDAGNVREAIRAARPWGVDACSRLEAAPGRKDHARMAAFVKAALAEAA